MGFKRRLAGLAIAPMLLAGATVMTGAGSAEAETCPSVHTQNDSTGTFFFSKADTLQSGPASVCPYTGMSVIQGTTFYAWCAAINSAGNTWVYGRVAGTEVEGWAWNGDLYTTGAVDNDLELC